MFSCKALDNLFVMKYPTHVPMNADDCTVEYAIQTSHASCVLSTATDVVCSDACYPVLMVSHDHHVITLVHLISSVSSKGVKHCYTVAVLTINALYIFVPQYIY